MPVTSTKEEFFQLIADGKICLTCWTLLDESYCEFCETHIGK